MAKSLRLEVVCEGIETKLQRDFMRDQDCRIGQGYFFSMPLAAEDFEWLLTNHRALP